jgi:hypothetical protein
MTLLCGPLTLGKTMGFVTATRLVIVPLTARPSVAYTP